MKKSPIFTKIRSLVARIPKGKVSTYGTIANLAGIKDSRQVGWAIYNNQDKKVPCHRVVNKDGFLAKDFSLGGWQEQKRRLVPEGVTFVEEMRVDMMKHFWGGAK